MAKKKKEEQRFFGQMPLPNSRKRYKTVKKAWNGLNRRITTDSGELSGMKGISTMEYPYLTPSKVLGEHRKIKWHAENCQTLGVFGFDNFLVVIYKEESNDNQWIKLDYINKAGTTYTGIIRDKNAEEELGSDGVVIPSLSIEEDDRQRCVVQFNVLEDILNPVGSGVVKKLIILPDKKTMDFYITRSSLNEDEEIPINDLEERMIPFKYPAEDDIETELGKDIADATQEEYKAAVADLMAKEGALTESEYLKNVHMADRRYIYRNEITDNCFEWYRDNEAEIAMWQDHVPVTFPDLDYAVVSHGRLFGVGRGRIYASGFNDYGNWTFDTADEYNEANAWCSSAQANTKADGEFTGITSYQGHVLAFKQDLTYEVYNTKNPFRVIDIYGDGTIDNRTIQEVNGNLFFVSQGAVHIYTGSVPKNISYNLNLGEFSQYDKAVSGSDGRNYYLWISKLDSANSVYHETMYVYDTYCDQWSVMLDNSETDTATYPVGIASNKNGVFFLRRASGEETGNLLTLHNVSANDSWYFETDLMTNESYDIKHLRKVQLRAEADEGAFTITAQYTDGKEEQIVYDYATNAKTDIVARFVLRKSAAYGVKLKFSGRGYVKFHNLELIYEDGGEVNVTL